MQLFAFMGVVIGIINIILVAFVLFFIKKPDPGKGRELAEIQELHERITDLSKHLVAFEKKIEKTIQETKTEHLAKLDHINQDVGKQLQEIHDNL